MKVSPFYSIASTDPDVYHDESGCPLGQAILPQNKRHGKGGFRKCKRCREISG